MHHLKSLQEVVGIKSLLDLKRIKNEWIEKFTFMTLLEKEDFKSEKETLCAQEMKTVWRTWKLNVDKLSPGAKLLLQLASFLAPENKPKEFVKTKTKAESELTQPVTKKAPTCLSLLK